MTKKRKTPKVKVVYRKVPTAMPSTDVSKVKSEISELEAKKAKAVEGKKGFRKFLASASYNKAISDKRRIVGRATQLQSVRQQTELEKAKRELEEVKAKRVDFNKIRSIKLEDLY